jgi:hypothetical protein
MAKLNSEFNYRYLVVGETVWEKIKTLLGFLDGRLRAAALEKVKDIKTEAIYEKLKYLKESGAPKYQILELEADIVEMESANEEVQRNFDHNKEELKILRKLLDELYLIAEPTRLKHQDCTPYTDEEMFEVNAANEFTVLMAREMQSEIISMGRPTAASIKNAMSNPITWSALKQLGIIAPETKYIAGGVDPTQVQLLPTDFPKVAFSSEDVAALTQSNEAQELQAAEQASIQRRKVSFA